jgi:hypothetical protein
MVIKARNRREIRMQMSVSPMLCSGIERQRTGTSTSLIYVLQSFACLDGGKPLSHSPSLILRAREGEGGNDQIAFPDNLVIMRSSKIKSEGSLTAFLSIIFLRVSPYITWG